VCLQQDTLALERVFERPAISLLEEDYLYTPGRLVVDSAGRMYVAAEGINQGLLQLDENGDFSSFMGAPDVHLDFFEILWRTFATEEQRNNMIKAVPTEYTSIAEEKLQKWLEDMERLRLTEYLRYVENRRRLFWNSFWSGIARGVGMAIGFTILGAVLVLILQDLARHNLPLIGELLDEIMHVVQNGMR
jgi:hypothetical protein